MLAQQPKDNEAHTTEQRNQLEVVWAAEEYARSSGMQFASIHAALQAHDWNTCDPFQRVLDVGCGNGKITAEIAARLPQSTVMGIDISTGMITFCHQQYQPYYRNLSFEVIDILSLPERFIEYFDSVTSFYYLHWIKNLPLALRQMYLCLKPAGQMIIYLASKTGGIPVLTELEKILCSSNLYPSIEQLQGYYPSEEELKTLAKQTGFVIEHCDEILYSYTYPDANSLLEWAMTMPYAKELPIDIRKQYFEQALENYLSNQRLQKNGAITVDFSIIRCYAHKPLPILSRL